jgi:hypothetical protein
VLGPSLQPVGWSNPARSDIVSGQARHGDSRAKTGPGRAVRMDIYTRTVLLDLHDDQVVKLEQGGVVPSKRPTWFAESRRAIELGSPSPELCARRRRMWGQAPPTTADGLGCRSSLSGVGDSSLPLLLHTPSPQSGDSGVIIAREEDRQFCGSPSLFLVAAATNRRQC